MEDQVMKKKYIQPKTETYKMAVSQMMMQSVQIYGNYSESEVEDL